MWRSTLMVLTCAIGHAQGINADAKVIEDFQKRLAEYVKLHDNANSALGKLKPTDSPDQITRHEKSLAHKIHEAREHVMQGNIFTADISATFHRLIGNAVAGGSATTVHQSLRRSEPVVAQLKVNRPYPEGLPLQTTPPSLLLNLPKLPPVLEYRVVGHALALHDVGANLIVDFLPNAIP